MNTFTGSFTPSICSSMFVQKPSSTHKTMNRHNVVAHVTIVRQLVPRLVSVFLLVHIYSTSIRMVCAKTVVRHVLQAVYNQVTATYVPQAID